jgi:hypothetical protein
MSNFQRRTIIFPRPSPLVIAPVVRQYLEQQGSGIGENPAIVNIRGPAYAEIQRSRQRTAQAVPQIENLFSNPAVATLVENPVVENIRATPIRTSQAGGVIEYVQGPINPATGNRTMIPRVMNNTAFSDTLPPSARSETIPQYLSRLEEEDERRERMVRTLNEPFLNAILPNFL